MSRAMVVLSGGQDSTTCLFWAKAHYAEVHAITFDYGQLHLLEVKAARKVANMAGVVSHEVLNLRSLLVSTSPLLERKKNVEHYLSVESMAQSVGDDLDQSFVPMRNALFLTIGANRLEALGGGDLVTGVCEMDEANFDDCREVFIKATERYINTALGHDHRGTPSIGIKTPLINKTKAQTVHMAKEFEGCWEALAYTHTSYDGKYPPVEPNHSNLLRAQGFELAGLPDPLVLRAWKEGLMDLPKSENYNQIKGG